MRSAMAFDRPIAEPPPTAARPSMPCLAASATASFVIDTGVCMRAPENRRWLRSPSSSASLVHAALPACSGVEMTIARSMPARRASSAIRRRVPTPKTIRCAVVRYEVRYRDQRIHDHRFGLGRHTPLASAPNFPAWYTRAGCCQPSSRECGRQTGAIAAFVRRNRLRGHHASPRSRVSGWCRS